MSIILIGQYFCWSNKHNRTCSLVDQKLKRITNSFIGITEGENTTREKQKLNTPKLMMITSWVDCRSDMRCVDYPREGWEIDMCNNHSIQNSYFGWGGWEISTYHSILIELLVFGRDFEEYLDMGYMIWIYFFRIRSITNRKRSSILLYLLSCVPIFHHPNCSTSRISGSWCIGSRC